MRSPDGRPKVSIIIPTHNRKDKLLRLLESVKASDYPCDMVEIVVVDDVSTDGTAEAIMASFPDVLLIRNLTTSFVSHTRNMGMANASGELLFLVDDDNVLDPQCISLLVEAFLTHPDAGMIGPIMYYLGEPKRIWCAGIDRSMVTSVTNIVGRDEMDTGQYSAIVPSKDFPNAFMISKRAFEKAGGFDENLFPFHYEESDIAERIRRAGFEILLQPKAKDWHDIPTPETTEDRLRLLHIHDPKRAYFAGRNRAIFFRLYSKSYERVLYLFIFNWAIASYYLVKIARNKMRKRDDRLGLAKSYVAGIFDGLRQDLATDRP